MPRLSGVRFVSAGARARLHAAVEDDAEEGRAFEVRVAQGVARLGFRLALAASGGSAPLGFLSFKLTELGLGSRCESGLVSRVETYKVFSELSHACRHL